MVSILFSFIFLCKAQSGCEGKAIFIETWLWYALVGFIILSAPTLHFGKLSCILIVWIVKCTKPEPSSQVTCQSLTYGSWWTYMRIWTKNVMTDWATTEIKNCYFSCLQCTVPSALGMIIFWCQSDLSLTSFCQWWTIISSGVWISSEQSNWAACQCLI